MTDEYQLTNDWFTSHKPAWRRLLQKFKPRRILEIGSYEGACTCFVLDTLQGIEGVEVYCVDSWLGGIEHSSINMPEVEKRFDSNVSRALAKHGPNTKAIKLKGFSNDRMLHLLAEGHTGTFD